MTLSRSTVLVLLSVALASPAAAHHRQTPPLVRLTTSGDTPLPRMASPGNKTIALIVDSALGKKVVSISPWRDKRQLAGCSTPVPTSCNLQTLIADAGDNANPAVAVSGRAFAFDSGSDPLQTGLPGRQVIGALKTTAAHGLGRSDGHERQSDGRRHRSDGGVRIHRRPRGDREPRRAPDIPERAERKHSRR